MMMTALGHDVILYAGDQVQSPVAELVTCITEDQRAEAVGGQPYASMNFDNSQPFWEIFQSNVIAALSKRIQPKDFICLVGGSSQKPIADAFPNHISVEFSVGYTGSFSKYRVFESYAWMHTLYTSHRHPGEIDGQFYDAVIPGFIEPEMFPLQTIKDDYFLYLGRITDRKGYAIAQQVCQELGRRLVLAGSGASTGYGEFVGSVGPERRAELIGGATATFAPTLYIEPFGYVVIESHACGTPTITTDWGAFVENNPHGETGYRCRTFAEFVKAAEDAPSLDPVKIHERAVRLYSLDAIAPQYERYFHRLSTLWGKGFYETTPSSV